MMEVESLKDKLMRPHLRQNQYTKEIKLRGAGYTRTIQGLYYVLQRLGIYEKASSKKNRY